MEDSFKTLRLIHRILTILSVIVLILVINYVMIKNSYTKASACVDDYIDLSNDLVSDLYEDAEIGDPSAWGLDDLKDRLLLNLTDTRWKVPPCDNLKGYFRIVPERQNSYLPLKEHISDICDLQADISYVDLSSDRFQREFLGSIKSRFADLDLIWHSPCWESNGSWTARIQINNEDETRVSNDIRKKLVEFVDTWKKARSISDIKVSITPSTEIVVTLRDEYVKRIEGIKPSSNLTDTLSKHDINYLPRDIWLEIKDLNPIGAKDRLDKVSKKNPFSMTIPGLTVSPDLVQLSFPVFTFLSFLLLLYHLAHVKRLKPVDLTDVVGVSWIALYPKLFPKLTVIATLVLLPCISNGWLIYETQGLLNGILVGTLFAVFGVLAVTHIRHLNIVTPDSRNYS